MGVAALDTDTIQFNYNDGVNLQNVTRIVNGTAVLPALIDISEADPYNMGVVAVGSSTNHLFTLTNNGEFDATLVTDIGLSAPFQFVGGSFPGTGGNCTAFDPNIQLSN